MIYSSQSITIFKKRGKSDDGEQIDRHEGNAGHQTDDFCEQVLNQDSRNGKAYLGKLMAELHVHKQEDLFNCEQPFDRSSNFQKAVRFGDDKLSSELKDYITYINERNENTRLTDNYSTAVSAMKSSSNETAFKAAASIFRTIPGFKDADLLAEQCLERAEVCRKDAIYKNAYSQMKGYNVSGYESAIKTLRTIPGWRDSDKLINACQRKIEDIKAREEAERLDCERQAEHARIEAEKAAKKRKRRKTAIVTSVIVVCIAFVIVLFTVNGIIGFR